MPKQYGAGVSTFDFIRESTLDVLNRRSAFGEDATALERRILVGIGLENATTVSFAQQTAFNPFDPGIDLPDVQITSRFTYAGERCDGLMLAVAHQDLTGSWVAVRSEFDDKPVEPDLSIARTQIKDPSWNTFIRAAAPPPGYLANVTLYVWLAKKPVTAPCWVSMELDLMVPQGSASGRLARPGRKQTVDALGQKVTGHDLQVIGVTKLALD